MEGLTLVFDLDGTLVDTAPDLIRATSHVLAGIGLPPVPGDELRPYVSHGSRRMIERALELNGVSREAAEIDRMWSDFLEFYAENIAVDSAPYPRLPQTIEALQDRNVRLAVCTNKREDLSRQLLGALGLAHRFAAICGRDTFPVCKPHPDHLTGAIAQAGGDARRAVMVGDSDTDVETARRAGIPIIGVTFGYSSVPMRALGPDAIIDHYAEFEAALGTVLGRLG